MEFIKIDSKKPEGELIKQIVGHLKKGGIMIYPTETAYGLGADARNQVAVRKVFKLKKREAEKSLSVIVSDFKTAAKFVEFSKIAKDLASRYWPGPLTLVLSRKTKIKLAKGVGQKGTLALRVSPHKVALAITKRLGGPLVATSANISGEKECYSVRAVLRQFKDLPSDLLIVDAGVLPHRKLSTIVCLTDKFEIKRQGAIHL